MLLAAARIDSWKIDEVRKYLSKSFVGCRVDDYPRGCNIAHLFLIAEPTVPGQRRKAHNLLVTRQFFDRFSDHSALQEALNMADVSRQLLRGDGRTVELY